MLRSQIKKCSFTIITIVFLSTIMSCGPSKKELAIRDQQVENENRKSILAKKIQQRKDAGEQPPPIIEDPGWPLAYCKCNTEFLKESKSVVLGKNKFFITTGFCGGKHCQYTCVNLSRDGEKILDYREWYCEGEDESCALSKWEDGQPTFDKYALGIHYQTIHVGENGMLELWSVKSQNSK